MLARPPKAPSRITDMGVSTPRPGTRTSNASLPANGTLAIEHQAGADEDIEQFPEQALCELQVRLIG